MPIPPEALKAFEYLKCELLKCPSFMNPIPGRRFYLHCDASKGSFDAFGNEINGQLGWCLTQKMKGEYIILLPLMGDPYEITRAVCQLICLKHWQFWKHIEITITS